MTRRPASSFPGKRDPGPPADWTAAFAGAARVLPFLLCLALAVSAHAADPVRIGFIGTFSGVGSVVGRDAREGFALVLRQLADRFAGTEVEVVSVDDARDPAVSRAQARRLASDGVRLFVLASASPESNAAAAREALAKGFVVAVTPTPVALAERECHQNFFSLAPHALAEHAAAARHFADAGFKRIWLVGADTAAGRALAAGLKGLLGPLAGETLVPPGTMSFASQLVAIERAAPDLDAIYMALPAGLGVNFLRQYAARGLSGGVTPFAPSSFLDQPYTAAMGEGALGAMTVAPWVEDLDNPVNLRMVAEFEGAYGRPPSVQAAAAYDAALLLDAAYRWVAADTATKDKTESLRNGLRRAEFSSVRGHFRFNTNHFPVQNWYLLQVVRRPSGRIGNEMRQIVLREWREPRAQQCALRWDDPLAPPPPPTRKEPRAPAPRR